MIDTLRRNPLTSALALACVVLVAIVAFELLMAEGGPPPASRRAAASAEAKLLPPLGALPPEQLYPESVNRPLWIPTRRPAPAPTVAAPSFPRGQFILQGVTMAGTTRIAMLREKASGRMHRVEKGRDVNGIQVAEVEADKVTLAQGEEREVLEMRVQRPGAPGAPATPAAPPTAASTAAGPFATAPAPAPGTPPGAPGAPPPPPAGSPFGAIPRPPQQSSAGPLPPGAVGANPAAAAPQTSAAPMTPEELLARRRARRNQPP